MPHHTLFYQFYITFVNPKSFFKASGRPNILLTTTFAEWNPLEYSKTHFQRKNHLKYILRWSNFLWQLRWNMIYWNEKDGRLSFETQSDIVFLPPNNDSRNACKNCWLLYWIEKENWSTQSLDMSKKDKKKYTSDKKKEVLEKIFWGGFHNSTYK